MGTFRDEAISFGVKLPFRNAERTRVLVRLAFKNPMSSQLNQGHRLQMYIWGIINHLPLENCEWEV